MKISTIIPAYNAAKTLRRCIESLTRQGIDSNEMEWIIVNDGSTDNTKEVCEKLKEQYSLNIQIIEQENKGVCGARNAGLEVAKGEYIHFLDSDDYLLENTYKEILQYDNDTTDYIGFWSYTIDEKVDIESLSFVANKCDVIYNGSYFDYYRSNRYLIFVWNGIYRLSTLKEMNVFFKEGTQIGEDVLFNFEFSKNNPKLILTNCVGLHYMTHSGQVTKSRNPQLMRKSVDSYLVLIKEIRQLGIDHPELEASMRNFAQHEIIPCLSRALSSDMTTSEYKELCETIKSFQILPKKGGGKLMMGCRFIVRHSSFFPIYRFGMKKIFLPFILPRLSRN